MNIAIVDDEDKYLISIRDNLMDIQIRFYPHVQFKITTFSDALSFEKISKKQEYDLVFLDIFIGESNGISIAKQLRRNDPNCLIVFLTSSRDFMPEAFSCHAFEYIIKPYTIKRIEQVMSDVFKTKKDLEEYITLDLADGHEVFYVSNIISVTTEGHYLIIKMINNDSIKCRITIKEFMRIAANFSSLLEINRGIIININHISTLSDDSCTMSDMCTYPIMVKKHNEIKRTIQNYRFKMLRKQQKLLPDSMKGKSDE